MNGRLATLAALIALLLAASALAAGLWLRSTLERAGAAEVAARFAAAQAVIEATRREELALRAGLLAADAALAAYMADALQAGVPGQPIDVASISDLLAERRPQLGLDALGVISAEGRWITGTRPWSDGGVHPIAHPLFLAARERQALVEGLVREGERWYLGSIQPIGRGGVVDAWLYAALVLDESWLARISALAPVTVRIAAAAEPGASPGLIRALFDEGERAVLVAEPRAADGLDPVPVLLGLALAWIVVGGVLAARVFSRVLAPAQQAVELLERAAAGDLHLRTPGWNSGLAGRFALAFERLLARARQN
jgi:hypothetical protein